MIYLNIKYIQAKTLAFVHKTTAIQSLLNDLFCTTFI